MKKKCLPRAITLCIFLIAIIVFQFTLITTNNNSIPLADAAIQAVDEPSLTFLKEKGIKAGRAQKDAGVFEYQLIANGLNILLVERHSAPVVVTMMVYHIGSRNEATGYTGATHFLEHMMFKGSKKFDPQHGLGIDDLLKPIGGMNNATTSFDRTNYFELVPAKYLSLCLAIEADRMRNLLLRDTDRQAEMSVVRNELERQENDPGSLLETQLFATAFKEHPYHNPIIGWRSDVEGVPTSRLRNFYKDYYYPNNATLIVCGDFNQRQALALIAEHFAHIKPSLRPMPKVYTQEPPQEGERRFVIQKGEDQSKVMIGYHVPSASAKATYPLDVIQALLGDDQHHSSRLYKRLVDTGLASDCEAQNLSLKDPGLFLISATATTGAKPEELEKEILKDINALKSSPVSEEELKRAKSSLCKRLRLASAEPLGMSMQLAEAIAVANWHYLLDYPSEINKVTTFDIMQAAQRYFGNANQTVGFYLPKDKTTSKDKNSVALAKDNELKGKEPRLSLQTPSSHKITRQLSSQPKPSFAKAVKRKQLPNGLTILVMPTPGIGTVAVSIKTKAGQCFAPDKTLVPQLLAKMLTLGSSTYSKEELAKVLEDMGTTIEVEAGNFWIDLVTNVVSEDLSLLAPLLRDMLSSPTLDNTELEKTKKIIDSEIRQQMVNTESAAWNALVRNLYKPGSPYYEKSFTGKLNELASITREDLRSFQHLCFSPNNTVIALVGDIDPNEAFHLIESHFSSWQPGQTLTVKSPEFSLPTKKNKIEVSISDKENIDVLIGQPMPISIRSPDYFAEIIGNAALGHDPFVSKLAPVRNVFGLTYAINSRNSDTSYDGAPWVIDFSVNPANLGKALNLVEKITSKFVRQGITFAELPKESGQLAGEFQVSLRRPQAVANLLTKLEMLKMSPSFIDEYPRKVKSVELAQVNRVIHQCFSLNKALTTIAGPLTKH